jgi:hypothetical protein
MTLFDERERAFESLFVHEEDLRFRVRARRNRLFGSWAAEQIGLSGAEHDEYVASFLRCALERRPDELLIDRVRAAFLAHGVPAFDGRIRAALTEGWRRAALEIRDGIPAAAVAGARPGVDAALGL